MSGTNGLSGDPLNWDLNSMFQDEPLEPIAADRPKSRRSLSDRMKKLKISMESTTAKLNQQATQVDAFKDLYFGTYVMIKVVPGPAMPRVNADVKKHLESPQDQKKKKDEGGQDTDDADIGNDEDPTSQSSLEKTQAFHDYWNALRAQLPEDDNNYGVDRVVGQLNTLYNKEIIPLSKVAAQYDTTQVDAEIKPEPHQLRAAACIERATASDLKGLLIADAVGNGKTLEASMPVVHSIAEAKARGEKPSPCTIMAPPGLTRQWAREIYKYYKNRVSTFIVKSSAFSPSVLYKYDVVIVSYNHVERELSRLRKYLWHMHMLSQGVLTTPPKRPRTPLLATMHDWSIKGPGKYLVMDEVHSIKNTTTSTFQAALLLRDKYEACIMLSATPLENQWSDAYAYIRMLRGHLITSIERFVQIFTGHKFESRSQMPNPKEQYLKRIQCMMQAFTIGRTSKVRGEQLPEPVFTQADFKLDAQTKRESNILFQEWSRKRGKKDTIVFAGLVDAQQIVMHSQLSDILDLYRREAELQGSHQELSAADKLRLQQWQENLSVGSKHRSPRINMIEAVLNKIRDKYPNDAVIIMEESKYFLKIVEVLLKAMIRRPPFWVINGDVAPDEREKRKDEFCNGTGFRVLLLTRGTGGLGLNLQAANHLIIAAQWWNEAAIEQAVGRIHRKGQEKAVFVYTLFTDCDVEKFKKKKREDKIRIINLIMKLILLDAEPGPLPVQIIVT